MNTNANAAPTASHATWARNIDPARIATECSARHVQSVIERAVDAVLRLEEQRDELLAALQRAERMLGDFQHLLGRQGARVDAVLDDARAAIAKATGGQS